MVEGAVRDNDGRSQGTILVRVISPVTTDAQGHLFKGEYLSASDARYRWWMTQDGGQKFRARCYYHTCEGNAADCRVVKGRSQILHLEKFRVIGQKEWKSKTPDWAFKGEPKKDLEAFEFTFNAEKVHGHGAVDLPWATDPGDGEEEESSSEEEEEDEEEGMVSRIAALREELKALEKKALKGGKAKTSKKEESTKVGVKEKKKKNKKRSPSPEEVAPKKKKKKKFKDEDKDKPKKKRKAADDDSSEEEGQGKGLFTAARTVTLDKPPKKADRGPFGSGPAVNFEEGGDSSSEDSQDFREAPAQQVRSSQLSLISYSRRRPGRLAARLLLKMREEAALGSAGAEEEPSTKTPVSAVQYFLTILQPQLAAKMNLRTQRELRTLVVVLDHLARSAPARAADVVAQRMKALERATSEGSWGAAQYLELIPSEHAGLLDRDEELHITKELNLERKVRGYEPQKPKGGGKNDRRGEKGQGKKGQAPDLGKGKTGKEKEPKT